MTCYMVEYNDVHCGTYEMNKNVADICIKIWTGGGRCLTKKTNNNNNNTNNNNNNTMCKTFLLISLYTQYIGLSTLYIIWFILLYIILFFLYNR